MPATLDKSPPADIAAKPYEKFLRWFAAQNASAFYIEDDPTLDAAAGLKADNIPAGCLPKEFANVSILAACWVQGLVEFGRCAHSFGYVGDHTGAIQKDNDGHQVTFAWIENGMNWSGSRRAGQMGLKDMLAEESNYLPKKVIRQTKVYNDKKGIYEIQKPEFPGQLLRLQVRLTDRGWGALAAPE